MLENDIEVANISWCSNKWVLFCHKKYLKIDFIIDSTCSVSGRGNDSTFDLKIQLIFYVRK